MILDRGKITDILLLPPVAARGFIVLWYFVQPTNQATHTHTHTDTHTQTHTHILPQQHHHWLVQTGSRRPSRSGPGRVKEARWEDDQLWRLVFLSTTTVDTARDARLGRSRGRSMVAIDKALPGGQRNDQWRRRERKRRGSTERESEEGRGERCHKDKRGMEMEKTRRSKRKGGDEKKTNRDKMEGAKFQDSKTRWGDMVAKERKKERNRLKIGGGQWRAEEY